MKKILIWLVVVIAAVWSTVTLISNSAKHAARAPEWPLELGRIDAVPARHPQQRKNAAAMELGRLAAAADIEFESRRSPNAPDPVGEYVRAQLQHTDRTIDPAPPISPAVAEIRAHLLSGQPIVWDVDISKAAGAPLPNLLAHMRVSRLLTASALERARLSEVGAWDDLRAQRTLSRMLWQRPELISALIALAIDRQIIAAARKMPRPAPAWFEEMRTFDYRKAMLAAMQADTWTISAAIRQYAREDDAGRNWVRRSLDRTVMAPYLELSRLDLVAHQRESAVELATVTACAFDAQDFTRRRMKEITWWNLPMKQSTPHVFQAWQRLFRLRAELELTEHALGLRGGRQSECSDGEWVVTPQSIKFSKPIPMPAPPNAVIPLEIRR